MAHRGALMDNSIPQHIQDRIESFITSHTSTVHMDPKTKRTKILKTVEVYLNNGRPTIVQTCTSCHPDVFPPPFATRSDEGVMPDYTEQWEEYTGENSMEIAEEREGDVAVESGISEGEGEDVGEGEDEDEEEESTEDTVMEEEHEEAAYEEDEDDDCEYEEEEAEEADQGFGSPRMIPLVANRYTSYERGKA